MLLSNNLCNLSVVKKHFLYIILLTYSYSQTCSQEVDWCFDLSTMSGYYFFIDININNETIEPGSVVGANDGVWECPNNDCDIIGAFYNNVCIGWTYPYFNNGYTIPVMINDGNFPDYLVSGEVPEFRLYDRSTGTIYNTLTNNLIPPCYHNGFEIIPNLYSSTSWQENIDYFIDLYEGQNLISFYSLPDNATVENVMQSIEINAVGIIGEGVVASNMGNGYWVGSLSEINRTDGYWIKMIEDDTLFINGKPEPNPQIPIYRGNNLISFPLNDTVLIADAIPDNIEDNFTSIIGESIVAQNVYADNNQFDEFWLGSLSHLQSKKGYWVHYEDPSIDYNTQVTFNFESENSFSREIDYSSRKNNSFEYIQSIEQAFYFIESIQGIELNTSDWILSFNNDQIVGARRWNGEYTDVPAMGYYDESTFSYCKPGDIPEFYLYNENSNNTFKLTGIVDKWSSNGIFTISLYYEDETLPNDYILKSPYPNPFNPITNIDYALPFDSFVSVAIYDMNGKMIQELFNSNQLAGYHKLTWNSGENASGLYLVKLTTENYQQTHKLMLIK